MTKAGRRSKRDRVPRPAAAPFAWVPGQGPDPGGLERMRQAFPLPAAPMGEAWFMSAERKMYPGLAGDLDALPDSKVAEALKEIASGTSAFGRRAEWSDWYHYLLPQLVERQWAPTFYNPVELLVTAFMCLHPASDGDLPYTGLMADALATLGQCIMAPWYWPDGGVDTVRCLGKWRGPAGIAGWADAGGLLSASLFLCIKYLPPADVEPWFRSAPAIPDRHWQMQLATWLVGAHAMLTGEVRPPDRFEKVGGFGIGWSRSHILDGVYRDGDERPRDAGPFLPEANRACVLRTACGWAIEDVLEDFMTDPGSQAVAAEVADMPERFVALYRAHAAVG